MQTELVETRWGQMRIFSSDPGCSRIIKEYGEYSPFESTFLASLFHPGDTVIDVGANIGGLTLPLAAKAGRVLAFEPQQEVCDVLRENVSHTPNIEVIQCALAEAPQTLYYGPETSNWVGSPGSIQLVRTPSEDLIPTEARTLDSFNLTPQLLKIDAEGMEFPILAGAQDTIRRSRPYIWLERNPEEVGIFTKICAALGYVYCTIDFPFFCPTNWRGNSNNIYRDKAHLSTLMLP